MTLLTLRIGALIFAAMLARSGSALAVEIDQCEPLHTNKLGPPLMAQPNGSFQTVSGDCTGTPGCNDYFDIILQSGDTLDLTFCSDGGSASFDPDLSIWDPAESYPYRFECDYANCGSLAQSSFTATGATQVYRVRIGAAGDPGTGGPYTLAYSAPLGATLVPVTCGDGNLDGGEQCDDGNDLNGDCCSASCQLDSAGTYCTSDGLFCTTDQCDAGGTCVHTNFPGCNMLPACGPIQPAGNPLFEHPRLTKTFSSYLVQAFVDCGNPGGNAPDTTTEGGIPACDDETFDQAGGSPADGWHWDSSKAYGKVELKYRCKGAVDQLIKLSLSGVVDANGNPVNGSGTLKLIVAMTIADPGGDMTTTDFPMAFPFTVINGVTKLETSINAALSESLLPPLPNGSSIELRTPHVTGESFIQVDDQNGNPFARPGVYLPDLPN